MTILRGVFHAASEDFPTEMGRSETFALRDFRNSSNSSTFTEAPKFKSGGALCSSNKTCDEDDVAISSVILLFSVLAVVENLTLVFAMHKWNLGKTCKMFAFLWHLSIADAIVALSFTYFHIRIISSCPARFGCMRNNRGESMLILVLFFSTIDASHLFILAATVDRFIAIKWSLRYTRLVTTWGTRVTAGCIWLVSILIPVGGALAMSFWEPRVAYSIVTLVCAVMCLSTAACAICLNLWLVRFAWTASRNAPAPLDRSSRQSREQSSANSFPDLSVLQDNGKLIVTLALFACSFILSCAPWSIALIACDGAQSCAAKQDEDYTLVLVLLHAVVIPVLYGFRVDDVKRRVIEVWKGVLIRFSSSC